MSNAHHLLSLVALDQNSCISKQKHCSDSKCMFVCLISQPKAREAALIIPGYPKVGKPGFQLNGEHLAKG